MAGSTDSFIVTPSVDTVRGIMAMDTFITGNSSSMNHSITFRKDSDFSAVYTAASSSSSSDTGFIVSTAATPITKNEYNTWDDWCLIPTTRPVVAMPTPTYSYVDIPGASGSLDLTDYLFGGPTYSDRTGSFDFYVDHRVNSDLRSIRNSIASALDGSVMKMYLTDDNMEYYYEGRIYLKQWTPDASYSKVTIEYRLKPYRYKANGKKAGL